MNYMAEIVAFERWLETHYLPISAQLLWYKLMSICNRAGWSEWVTVDNLRLMAAMQMGREATLIKARDELIKAGLIDYQKGKKGSPNRYKIISLLDKNTCKNVVQSEVQRVVQSEVYPVVYPVVQSVDINKHKQKQKQKQDNITPISPLERFEDFLSAYPKPPDNRQATEVAYCKVLLDDSHLTESDLIIAAENYADAVCILGTEERYIKGSSNFLKDNYFAAYLDGNYKKPKPPKKSNDANKGMMKTDYGDISELEKELTDN